MSDTKFHFHAEPQAKIIVLYIRMFAVSTADGKAEDYQNSVSS
jgi:hypothetical protein